ncbi:serine hydrolase [Marinoscillum sp.]|uniref:serine hydrolase n=1 Tax=Marinoscillum sp. TaxID=2024838 RepID=UPI003BA9A383
MKQYSFITLFCLTLIASAQPDTQVLDEYLSKARKDWEVPGMAVAIVKDGEIVLAKGYGTKALTSKEPVNGETLFAIASNTKAFIASSLAKLVAEGKIKWTDRVIDYLPYFELYDSYTTTHTTIEDLLSHRVGLGTFSGDLMWYKSELTAEEVIKKVRYVPQAYDFRAGYGYSNLMFITAGEVIKKVTGKEWSDYVKESFFKPLGMSRTITSTDDLSDNYAMPHKPMQEKQEVIDWVNWDNMGAAGGIISSANDMAQWMILNLNRGVINEDTLIDPSAHNILWTPHNNHVVSLSAQDNLIGRHFSGYGLGWGLSDYDGNLMVTHGGGYDGMYSYQMLIPDQKLGVMVLTNTMKGLSSAVALWVVDRFLENPDRDYSSERLKASKENASQADAIDERLAERNKKVGPTLGKREYVGTYESGMHGQVTITLRDDGTYNMNFADAPKLSATLTHWHYNIWQINWDETHAWFDFGTVQFLLDNNLKVSGLQFDVPNHDIFFDEVNLRKID